MEATTAQTRRRSPCDRQTQSIRFELLQARPTGYVDGEISRDRVVRSGRRALAVRLRRGRHGDVLPEGWSPSHPIAGDGVGTALEFLGNAVELRFMLPLACALLEREASRYKGHCGVDRSRREAGTGTDADAAEVASWSRRTCSNKYDAGEENEDWLQADEGSELKSSCHDCERWIAGERLPHGDSQLGYGSSVPPPLTTTQVASD